jgi:hypothetical protein
MARGNAFVNTPSDSYPRDNAISETASSVCRSLSAASVLTCLEDFERISAKFCLATRSASASACSRQLLWMSRLIPRWPLRSHA